MCSIIKPRPISSRLIDNLRQGQSRNLQLKVESEPIIWYMSIIWSSLSPCILQSVSLITTHHRIWVLQRFQVMSKPMTIEKWTSWHPENTKYSRPIASQHPIILNLCTLVAAHHLGWLYPFNTGKSRLTSVNIIFCNPSGNISDLRFSTKITFYSVTLIEPSE